MERVDLLMSVVIASGLGGHAAYAAAIAHYLVERGIRPTILVPRGHEWVRRKLERYGRVVEVTMPRNPGESLYRGLCRWPTALLEAVARVGDSRGVVVSCGSNFGVSAALVGRARGMSVVSLEALDRISRPSLASKALEPLANATVVHWPEQRRLYPKAFLAGPIYEPPKYSSRNEGYVLVTAGTLGYRELFDAVSKLELESVVLQTGLVEPEPYRRRHPQWRVFDFDPDLERWIAGARVVITHFPGMTAATAALGYRKPVVMVASPHHRFSSPLEDGVVLARKLNAIYIPRPSPALLKAAVERAERVEPPQVENGAARASMLIAKLIR